MEIQLLLLVNHGGGYEAPKVFALEGDFLGW